MVGIKLAEAELASGRTSRRGHTGAPSRSTAPPPLFQRAQLLALQRTAGNAAVADLIAMQRCEEDDPARECMECGRPAAAPVQRQDGGTPIGASGGTPDAGVAPSPTLPQIAITRTGSADHTFISTDDIGFSAQVSGGMGGADAGTPQVSWAVTGVSGNSGGGNPHTATSQANFSFKPNPTHRLKTGSRSPNDPIQYQVEAKAGTAKATFDLEQDEKDIIRQEYVDFGATPPPRSDIATPSNSVYNVGNYTQIVDKGMDTAMTNTRASFGTLTQAAAPHPSAAPATGSGSGSGGGSAAPPPVPVPAIHVSSGYRNPRRNVAAGSKLGTGSQHVWGRALDLKVDGANATLWTRLRQAGADAGNSVSICEIGPDQVECDNDDVDHVHINF